MANLKKEQELIQSLLESFYEALDAENIVVLSDLTLQLDLTTGEVSLSTPDEAVTSSVTVYDWITEDPDARPQRAKEAHGVLQEAIRRANDEGYFERPIFQPPLAVHYSDGVDPKDRVLLELTDEWSVTDTPLLANYDQELELFLSQLLAKD